MYGITKADCNLTYEEFMRRIIFAGILLIVVVLSGCAGPNAAADDGRLKVVAITGHIGDAVQEIAGDTVQLTTLLGPGIDPHTYVATEGDIFTFQSADLILANGLHLEAQLERVLDQIGQRSNTTVVAVGDTLDPAGLLNWEPEAGFPYDPHVWNDVQLWQQVVEAIRDALIAADPTNSAVYSANAATYLAELAELDAYIRTEAARIPEEQRVIVTAHDAFGYFGRAYGFEVEAVQGISTQAEASTADIQALVSIVVERQVPAIFIETTISPRTIEAVQAAVRSAGHDVALGGSLYSDALGSAGSPTATYIGMMRHNIDTIVAALANS
jgi:manganese/zinc/iron transport system substrate-binding protein